MSKKFDIHEWQAKQKRLNEELGPQSSKLDLLTDRILNVTGGRLANWQMHDKITSSHDMMALYERDKDKLRIMIYNLLRDDINEMSTTGTGASITTGAGEAYATPKAFKKKNKED
tara:strand:+ start:684 stop:1028 length:345 start_codon:yes stop_codon:yes gene_type:complete